MIAKMRRGKKHIESSSEMLSQTGHYPSRCVTEYDLVLWRNPVTTLHYFTKEFILQFCTLSTKLYNYCFVILILLFIILSLVALSYINGPHQSILQQFLKKTEWCLYWLGLGILSSVGLGSGLHTFLLYLGPHIASVTLAGYECGSLNFPEPPYPNKILCPSVTDPQWTTSMVNIMRKVYLEAVMWGTGTAVGELPPYFIARAARLSSDTVPDDEEVEEDGDKLVGLPKTVTDHLKLFVQNIIEKVGFFGILACASIPNPLFDLAGIMCGHFLVPFWKFFGATLIGKAIIKMTIQKVFIIVALNETLFTKFLNSLSYVPGLGKLLKSILSKLLTKQKEKLHTSFDNSSNESSIIEKLFECIVFIMTCYFVISVINSFARNYKKRMSMQNAKKYKKAAEE